METEINMDIEEAEPALKISREVGKLLYERKQTVAVAESVTSGQLQTFLSIPDHAMDFFQGGITAYNLGQKTKHLDVDPIHALACNCVSERIAASMARNVMLEFNSDWGIGITGYASPVPEKNIEELFSCFAIAGRGESTVSGTIDAKTDTQFAVSRFYTRAVLEKFLEHLRRQSS
jgi:nicotinamide-nucleotide amidase